MTNNYFKLREELYNKLKNGYYDNLPPYSFSKDELYLKYCFGWVEKPLYDIGKQRLEMLQSDYFYSQNKIYKYPIII